MIGVVWKISRIAAKVLLAVLAITALLVGVTWTFLQTRHGGEMVRRLALPRVNDAIAGQVALGRFAFGGDRLTLENLVIYDPEARPVAHVARIDVVFSPLALLRRHVEVAALNIRRPELALVQDARGLNLMRALAPRQTAAPGAGEGAAPDAGGRRGAIDVRALSVTDGVIDYRSSSGAGAGGAARHVHVAELSINGSASLSDDRLAADAAVKMRGGRVDARAAFDVPARRGHATARASLRGVALAMDGDLNGDAVAARVSVEAADLAATSRGLTRDFGLPRIAMAGNGRLDVVAGGTLAAPSLRVTARFPALAQGKTRLQSLTVSAWIPDLGVPEALDVDARASTLSLGGQTLRSPVVTVHAAGRTDVTVHAAIAAPQPLRVDLTGTRRPGERRALNIDALRVAYPEATWTLRHRARLSFGDAIVLSGFELGADAQRLAAELHLGDRSRNAHVTVARLDLGRLPRALVPPALGLGGTVDVDLRSEGVRSPRIVVDAALAGGRIRGHRNLSFDLAGQLAGGRARGRLRARALGIAAAARFDLPGQWPPRNQRAPIALDVDVSDTDIAVVAAAIAAVGEGPPPRVKGRARVSIKLDGRIGQPRLRAAIAGKGLAFDDRQIGDLDLTVSGEGDGKLAAHVASTAPARTNIDITTPLSLRSILRQPPDAATFMRTPFEIRGNLDRLPLAVLARAASRPERVAGTLSSEVAVSGTIAELKGTIAVDVAGAAMGRFPPTDARIELDFDPGAVEARARVTRKGRPLLAAETRVGAPLGGLLRPARLAVAPLRVRAVLGPLSLQRLGLPPETDREAPRQLKGKLHADLAIDGTIGAPRVLFHAQAGDLALDSVGIGFAQIEATYADHKAKVDAQLSSVGGGTLHTTAAMTADLGYPAVLRGLNLRRTPFDVRLDAQRFDVRGLSGVTQQIRTVGGLLTASITIRGTASDPRVAGKVEWKDGVLAVSEFGEFKEIHLALHGSEDDLVLDELAAKSGAGRARVTGSARHETGRGYHLSAEAKLDRFPLYTEGQPLATVALAARVSGRVQLFDTRLKVDIDDARVALPDAERRKLQPLETPADVVLVDKGAPLNRAQAKKLEALLHEEPDKGAARRAPSLRLKVNAPRHLWVEGKDAKLELGVSPDFKVSVGDKTEVFGQVTVHRGRVDVYGKRFDLKADSTLTFGGSPERPILDVRAEHTNATQKVTVLVTAKGPLDKLQISVTAPNRPELSESQLYTLILTGQLQFGGGTSGASPSTQAASLVGGFLVSKLQSTLAHRLPFDVFTIDTGGEGVRGTRLEAGRYLTDRFYVGYIGRVGSDPTRYQNRNAVHLEYQITARWEIEAEYGDLGTGTADLMWKKNY